MPRELKKNKGTRKEEEDVITRKKERVKWKHDVTEKRKHTTAKMNTI